MPLPSALLLFIALLGAGLLGQSLRIAAYFGVVPFWPSTGIALAGVLLLGPRAAWIVFGALWLAALPWRPPIDAGVFAGIDALAAVGAAAMLRRVPGFDARLVRRRDVLAFLVLGAMAATVAMAFASSGYRCLATPRGCSAFWPHWLNWWLSNAGGVLVGAPPLLLWSRQWFADLRRTGRLPEALGIYGALLANTAATPWLADSVPGLILQHGVPLPLLLWASLRFPRFGAPSAVLIASAATLFTMFELPAGQSELWRGWAYIVSLSATGLLVTALEDERRRAEAQRQSLAHRQAAMVRALGEIVYDWDVVTDTIEWQGDADRLAAMGAAPSGAPGGGWAGRVHPEDRARALASLQAALTSSSLHDCEYRLRCADGRELWIHDRGAAFADAAAASTRVVGVMRDIGDRKQAEHAIRQSEERFRIAASFGSDVIYEWDLTTGRCLHFGRVAQLFGAANVAPRSAEDWRVLVHADDRERVEASVDRHIEHGAPFAEQYRIMRRDGGIHSVSDRSLVVADGQGRPVKRIGVLTDVTRQRQLEEQLRQAQKMESVGLLAGGVAHDFNNLLQVIQGHALLAAEAETTSADRETSLRHVQHAAERAAQLTRQLLAFSRRQPLQMQDTDLPEVARQLLQMIRRVIGEHIEVALAVEGPVGNVRCDRAQIEQVLVNLCVNARDAMPHGGQLTLRVEEVTIAPARAELKPGMRPGRFAIVQVRDSGIGMDPETRRRIFEPFFTTKPEGRGTGLGLAVAYGVIKQHDGYIDAESEPGQGCTFTIYLPVAPSTRAGSHEPAVARAAEPGGGAIVLLAEDEPSVRELARTVLERAGYCVLAATTGEEALRAFRAAPARVELAILDAVMPRMSGAEAARRMRAERPDLRVLICSGYPRHEADVVMEAGPEGFLAKPYRPADLLERVRLLVSRRTLPAGATAGT